MKIQILGAALLAGSLSYGQSILTDFSSFALSGTYEAWTSATITSGPSDYQIVTTDFGGGWYNLPSAVNGGAADTLTFDLDVNAGNVATLFNVVLIDADGTERVFRFDGLTEGADQSLNVALDDFLQDNSAGTSPGLDISSITALHIQGTFTNGNPGLVMNLTFDNLALTTAVPEPAGFGFLLGLLGLGFFGARRRR